MCCYLQALKVLRTAEYTPFIVFIAAPTMSSFNEVNLLAATVTLSLHSCHKMSPLAVHACLLRVSNMFLQGLSDVTHIPT